MTSEGAGDERVWVGADGTHVDLRGLRPPEPLVRVLKLLPTIATGGALIVHLERDPVMLYPELAEAGWQAEPLPAPEGEFRLRLSAAR